MSVVGRAFTVGLPLVLLGGSLSAVTPALAGDGTTAKPTDAPTEAPALLKKVPVRVQISPDHSDTYGVGQLVTARFSQAISNKSAVEKAITVTGTQTLGAGSWGWIDDQTAVYRPRKFWPANTDITFTFALGGLVLGETEDSQFVGANDRTYTLQVGRAFVMTVRDSKHRLFVTKDGKQIKALPVSLGKRGWETRSGVKILTGEKYVRLRMVGYDPGAKERWDVVAPYSIRLTPTGEFIHGAPWARYRMGKYNGSHGCTNMFPKDAKWLYHRVRAGDPVVTRGTGRRMTTDNGVPGAYWNFSWSDWQQKSAITGKPAKVEPAAVPPIEVEAGP